MQVDKSPIHLFFFLVAYLLFISTLYFVRHFTGICVTDAPSRRGQALQRRGEGSQAERSRKSERQETNVSAIFILFNFLPEILSGRREGEKTQAIFHA